MAETKPAEPVTIYRKNYKPTPYLVDQIFLSFDLNEDVTVVTSTLHMVPNYGNGGPPPIEFNGRSDVVLESIKVNGETWPAEKYTLDPKILTLEGMPLGEFDVEIVTKIKPQDNTTGEGLYKSSGNFCTQCEAEGFRAITFSYDRPDVMSKYTVRIEGDKTKYPVLLSNGNLEESGDLPNERHFALWVDPHKKPCYLFALVAGDLAVREDTFVTMSGRSISLKIYAQHHNIDKVGHAMQSLIESMKWDEVRFGREYDLDLFNIVAVDDFNMGAMENKSLNVFNSKYVLASPETATDTDFYNIQGVVGHEYFHNWTGNRVTCKDWFQLTLKEGLTVYRDQEFTSDLNSRAVKRINDVDLIRSAQFSEDAGPLSHAIRPDSYIKMDNFYTLTVYEKGAEVIRLYSTILGREGFRKGMDLYFERHDGQAVTCDDFRAAMADANGKDLTSLGKWYSQAGTPCLTLSGSYDEANGTFTVSAKQVTPPTPGQDKKVPLLIPIAIGLLGPDGKDIPIKLQGSDSQPKDTVVIEFDTAEAEYILEGVHARPVPSFLREYSAPVKLEVIGETDDDLMFLFANDSDPFNRWNAGQRLYKTALRTLYDACIASTSGTVRDRCLASGGLPARLVDAFKSVLEDSTIDGQFASLAVTLPSQSELVDEIPEVDPVLLHEVYEFVMLELAVALKSVLVDVVKKNDGIPGEKYSTSPESCAKRSMKNRALSYLGRLDDSSINQELLTRFREASNMTDSVAAIRSMPNCPERDTALQEFYEKWKHDGLVCQKWLAMQAMSDIKDNLKNVQNLLDHPAFIPSNPNCNYSLLGAFSSSPVNFHNIDGSGYLFLAKELSKLDKRNPQVAARLLTKFSTWRRVDKKRQSLIKDVLQKLLDGGELSENSFEVVSANLK